MLGRRSGTGDTTAVVASVDALVARVEAGSGNAAARLARLAPSEPSVLDALARSASAGARPSLDLLLDLIVELRLVGPALSRLVDDRSCDDIEQDVLVAVTRSIGSYRGEARFTTWLYAVARNTAIGHLRRTSPTAMLATDDGLADPGPRLSSAVAQREAVRVAIDSLPSAYRDAVIMRDIEGLSYAEIGQRLDLNLNTVKSRLSRGRALVAGSLA
jgi:RNA polymerase sigma-70 factor (ECF subfamily)